MRNINNLLKIFSTILIFLLINIIEITNWFWFDLTSLDLDWIDISTAPIVIPVVAPVTPAGRNTATDSLDDPKFTWTYTCGYKWCGCEASNTECMNNNCNTLDWLNHMREIVCKSDWSVWDMCDNGVSGKIDIPTPPPPPPPPPPPIIPCSCEDWSSEWSNCDANSYNWTTVNKCTRQCVQTLNWTSNTKNWIIENWNCSVSCNPRWSDNTKVNTVEIPWCDPTIQCWTHNWEIYTASDLNWRTGTFCTSWSPTTLPFPVINSTKTWTCGTVSCSASRTDWTGWGAICWDWQVDIWEQCDLWFLNGWWSCTTSCTIPWWSSEYCWDWEKDIWEQCDDANNLSWDWCSSTCTEENDPICTWPTCIWWWYCWDWIIQGSETCDDGNYIGNDSCKNDCTEWIKWWPNSKWYCWDWKPQTPNSFWFQEACDDGNTNNNDNCTNNCTSLPIGIPDEGTIVASAICTKSSSWYANNSDTIPIYAEFTIDDLKDNKDVINLWTPTDFLDLSNNVNDRVNVVWDSSLTFNWIEIIWNPTLWTTQNIQIGTVSSKTPFVDYTNKISFKLWWQTIVMDWVCYNFKKPYKWKLALLSSWSISLWTKLKYKLSAEWNVPWASSYAIWLWVNNISYYWINITLQNTKLMPYFSGLSRQFETRINSSIYATKLNQQPWLQAILPTITYTLWGKTIRYYLSTYEYGNDRTPITISWDKFLWVKIIWWLQWGWKYEFTWQNKNISNLYPSNLRTEIRKRAYDYTKKMTSWQILNKVKYVDWDILLSGEITQMGENYYETLVVKNGNVIINWNLNTLGNKLWIIILKDNYDTSNWYNWKWNIFVNPEVTKINAMIYADWWFMSTDSSWNVYATDSTARTNALQNQLTMIWSLFTRNTIWWAQFGWVKNGWTYMLPGWTKTQSFDRAMIYDLNYIRRWNFLCNKSVPPDIDCTDPWEYEEWFIIKYDSRIQTSPPKLFYK